MKNKRILQTFTRDSMLYLKKYSPTLLTFLGAIGVVTTSVMTAKATVKAMELINEAECEKRETLTKKAITLLVGPSYFPSILVGASTIACIIGANMLNKKHQAMLSSAYALINTSFKEYKAKLKELYGEEAHNKIIDAIAVEKAKDVRITSECFLATCDLSVEDNDGEPKLFYEQFSRRYFESTIEKVMSAEYHLNRNYVLRGCAVLNEFYEFLGLEKTDYGDVLGWAPVDEGMYWLDFNHRKVVMDDGLECYIVEMMLDPVQNYDEW